MDTTRVDIAYRPLKIAWAVHSQDRESLRSAVRLTHTLWGGCFNPVVAVDDPEQATQIIDLFRADMIVPIGDNLEVQSFPDRFPHLINPLFPKILHFRDKGTAARARVPDIGNALKSSEGTPEWQGLKHAGIRRFMWEADDPLADTFLLQRGAFPTTAVTGVDYDYVLARHAVADELWIEKNVPIPNGWVEHPGLNAISRIGLYRHYTIRAGWDYAGFYVGSADDSTDLMTFWNLRAADIQLHFFDPRHADRYEHVRPSVEEHLRDRGRHFNEHQRKLAIWSRGELDNDIISPFQTGPLIICRSSGDHFWSDGTVRPPTMVLGEASTLGVVDKEAGNPKVQFALPEKPFASDLWFHTQHLVASVSLNAETNTHTFHPPPIPEWNEFLARAMHFHFDRLRVEPERIGIIIQATDHDTFLIGLSTHVLIERLFDFIGFKAKLISAGLITQQLVSKLGGLNGARVLKIPGVRRLFHTYGPRQPFAQKAALQLIGGRDPDEPSASFANHKDLYIEQREIGTELTPPMVFEYLVEKDLLRIGATLTCPACGLATWVALDHLKQRLECDLCGEAFNATKQLVREQLQYRRSGVLGVEKHSQGAIPVALLLQQLKTNLGILGRDGLYAPSYDLCAKDGISAASCEVDFVVMLPPRDLERTRLIIGECKDRGGSISKPDVENLRRVADAFPKRRFETFIAFVKLSEFTESEIELTRSLNTQFHRRVIMLTARELEPYTIYERTNRQLGL